MADEIRVERDDVDIEVEVDDPEAARAQIAHTRARMSGTIDEIEDVLLRRKEKIQHKLDPFSAVRKRPLQSAGIVFGAGLVLGLLTGGDDDDDDLDLDWGFDDYDVDVDLEYDGAASRLGRKARRAASRTREALHMAPAAYAAASSAYDDDDWDEEEWDDDDDDLGSFSGLRDAIADRLGPILRNVGRQLIDGNRSS
jgi:ElaB/YqjD/DUF883 family membrane-anchored ribosome-binding protein